ncbi:MAG: trypsin-like peptidase domain-containing protein [Mariniblastus sp.]|nr:trypsin-like peptidase domain-containing protein [Mariniblastus sp.]
MTNNLPSKSQTLWLSLALITCLQAAVAAQPMQTAETPFRKINSVSTPFNEPFSVVKNVVKSVRPMVVHIEAKKPQKQSLSTGENRQSSYIEEAGSGIVLKHGQRHYVVTNYHVIENSSVSDIRIEADGKWFLPTRVVHDRETDLSVMFVDRDDLVPALLGDSTTVDIGDFVVAIGSPFGLSHSVSYGIVSAMGRRDLELGPQGVRFQNFIQTDAAINPGNSGGPLINLQGEVIGINTAIASNSGGSDGIGFSIPINMVTRIVSDLIDHGEVQRGFLGVSLDARFTPRKAISMGLERTHGARVSAITPNSPAGQVDLQVGDIILEFEGRKVANDSHLVTEVSLTPIGTTVELSVFRKGGIRKVQVKVGDRNRLNIAG